MTEIVFITVDLLLNEAMYIKDFSIIFIVLCNQNTKSEAIESPAQYRKWARTDLIWGKNNKHFNLDRVFICAWKSYREGGKRKIRNKNLFSTQISFMRGQRKRKNRREE